MNPAFDQRGSDIGVMEESFRLKTTRANQEGGKNPRANYKDDHPMKVRIDR